MARSRRTAAKAATSGLPALSSLDNEQMVSRRWEEGLPHTADYYYDEPLPEKTLTRTSKDIAPDGLDLADVWVVAIMQAVSPFKSHA